MKDEQYKNLSEEVNAIKAELELLRSASTIPLAIDQSLTGRGFTKIPNLSSLSGILKISGGIFSSISGGVSGTFYAASTSGGGVTHLITVTNGVITSIA